MEIEINLHSKTPAYRQLADAIRDAISSGELEARQPIPSLTQLVGQTGLAMSTVQKAIRELEREHYVYTVSGRGTFVTPRNHEAG